MCSYPVVGVETPGIAHMVQPSNNNNGSSDMDSLEDMLRKVKFTITPSCSIPQVLYESIYIYEYEHKPNHMLRLFSLCSLNFLARTCHHCEGFHDGIKRNDLHESLSTHVCGICITLSRITS